MVDQPGAAAAKDDWRAWAGQERATLDWESVSSAVVEALLGWPPLRSAESVLLYLPLADEVDLTPLQDAGLRASLLATRTPDHGGALTVHHLDGPLEVHRFGFLQPHAAAPEVDPYDIGILLMPGLAFDIHGNRIGRGAGYYDVLLGRTRRGAFTVGVTPVELVVDDIPVEPHDRRVRFLATQEGVVETASR